MPQFPLTPLRIIALINQKGGVGKTTCTANLGACLAEAGKRVLTIDLDPQANLTDHLGISLEDTEFSVRDVLSGNKTVAEAVAHTSTPRLDILPSDVELAGMEIELASVVGREIILREAMEGVEDFYDYILIDCPPSLGLLTLNALTTATEVFIVLQTEYFALQGTSQVMETLKLVQRRLNRDLDISGVIACLFDRRKNICKEVYSEIRRFFGDIVFHTPIRTNVALTEAPSHGLPIISYDAKSNGAYDFRVLAQEVIKREVGIRARHYSNHSEAAVSA